MFMASAVEATFGRVTNSIGKPMKPLFAQDIPMALNVLATRLSLAIFLDQMYPAPKIIRDPSKTAKR